MTVTEIALFGNLPEGRKPWTAEDYRRRDSRHNAQVFADIYHREIFGIDDEGLFEAGESAGTIRFRDLVDSIERTDIHGLLSEDEAENTAAMVYHLTPDMKNG